MKRNIIRLGALCAALAFLVTGCYEGEDNNPLTRDTTPEEQREDADNMLSEGSGSATQPRQGQAQEPDIPPQTPPAGEQPPVSEQPQPTPVPTPDSGQEAEVDLAKIAPTTQMTYAELVGSGGDDASLNPPPAGTYWVEVDVTNRITTVYDSNNQIVRQMLCTVGAKNTPTPVGTFRSGEQRNRFEYFEKYKCYAQYWTHITGEILFHSVLYKEKDVSTVMKNSYRNLGRATSHGCVRLTVPDAKWIYENIAPGTKIIVRKKERNKALVKLLELPPIE